MTQDVRSGQGDLAPGERIAGYEIQQPIGRGGMAVVYRALDLRLGRLVALKVLAPHLGEDEAFRQRFMRESRAAAGVDHPHIIPVFEAGESGGVLFIAMRYVSHGDVRSLLDAEGKQSPARTLEIAGQVASALDAAHALRPCAPRCQARQRAPRPGQRQRLRARLPVRLRAEQALAQFLHTDLDRPVPRHA